MRIDATKVKNNVDFFCLISIGCLAMFGTGEVSNILNAWWPGNEKVVDFVVSIVAVWLVLPYILWPAVEPFVRPKDRS